MAEQATRDWLKQAAKENMKRQAQEKKKRTKFPKPKKQTHAPDGRRLARTHHELIQRTRERREQSRQDQIVTINGRKFRYGDLSEADRKRAKQEEKLRGDIVKLHGGNTAAYKKRVRDYAEDEDDDEWQYS